MKRINYSEGDNIGSCGIKYIKEAEPYVNRLSKEKLRKAYFKCGICGTEFVAIIGNVKKGTTTSCGCVFIKTHTTHQLRNTKAYRIWNTMIQRCENKNDPNYLNYGARGISVCSLWRNNFESFYLYVSSLLNYGKENYIIDRINNDGNYEPGNLKWSTYHSSNLNKRMSRHNTSGYIGVSYSKRDELFLSYITVKKKQKVIKYSKDPVIVARARDNYIKINKLIEYKLNNV